MEESEESEPSPDVGPPATGERSDHRAAAPGVELPDEPEKREVPEGDDPEGSQTSEKASDADEARKSDDDEARQREDDLA